MQHLFIFLTCFSCLVSCAQKNRIEQHLRKTYSNTHTIGETPVRIIVHEYPPANGISFVVLHDNEQTATEAAEEVAAKYGGRLVLIENNNKRNISFILRGRSYSFDPNRMFSASGIIQSLRIHSRYNEEAAFEVSKFASFVLSQLGEPRITVALHNNRDNTYSILQYVSGKLKNEAAAVYQNPEMDRDDFVLTTNRKIFEHFRAANISVVLQKDRPFDDGSLSVLSGKSGKDYVNIESQHFHNEMQVRMIEVLYEMEKID